MATIKHTTELWSSPLSLRDALRHVTTHYNGDAISAKAALLELLSSARLPSRYLERRPHGWESSQCVRDLSSAPEPEFGPLDEPAIIAPDTWRNATEIYWECNRLWHGGLFCEDVADLCRIEVPRSVVRARWPIPAELEPSSDEDESEESPASSPNSSSKTWVTAEAERMKMAGAISPDTAITDLAKELEKRMKRAARCEPSLRPVSWRYIKNELANWGVWPMIKH